MGVVARTEPSAWFERPCGWFCVLRTRSRKEQVNCSAAGGGTDKKPAQLATDGKGNTEVVLLAQSLSGGEDGQGTGAGTRASRRAWLLHLAVGGHSGGLEGDSYPG